MVDIDLSPGSSAYKVREPVVLFVLVEYGDYEVEYQRVSTKTFI